MTHDEKHNIALMRYSAIAPVINESLPFGQSLHSYFTSAAEHPLLTGSFPNLSCTKFCRILKSRKIQGDLLQPFHSDRTGILSFPGGILRGRSGFRKVDNFRIIQENINRLALEKRITPVIILDEANHISNAIRKTRLFRTVNLTGSR